MLTGDQAYILSKEYTDAHGGGSGGTSNYSDLTNKPMINSVTLTGNKTSSDLGLVAAETGKGLSTNDYTDADETKLAGIEAGAQVNVQADWTEADNTSDAYINHKPTLGTAAAKDSTNAVTDGSVDLVESGAVHSAIAAAISPVQGAVSANTSAISDIKDGTSIDSFGDVETALADKADKVSSATNGDLAGLDANGNLTDSGILAANVADHAYVDSGDSAQEALTRASVGWTGKNAFSLTLADVKARNTAGTWVNNVYTKSGATFTILTDNNGQVIEVEVDTDNSATTDQIQFNLKKGNLGLISSKSYKMNGCPTGASSTTYFMTYNSGDSPTTYYSNCYEGDADVVAVDESTYPNDYVAIYVRSGQTISHKKFYPMLRDARIKDSTFEPYHESVADTMLPTEANTVLGAHNLFRHNGVTETIREASITVNSDRSIAITTDGSMSAFTEYVLCAQYTPLSFLPDLKAGKEYIANGSPEDSVYESHYWFIIFYDDNGVLVKSLNLYGTPTKFIMPAGATKFRAGIVLQPGATLTNAVYKPMIRLASDPDDTYVPYAMTNRELTEKVSSNLATAMYGVRIGNIKQVKFTNTKVANLKAYTVPEEYRPSIPSVLSSGSGDRVQQFQVIIRSSAASGTKAYLGYLQYAESTGKFERIMYAPTYGAAFTDASDDMIILGCITYI